MYYIVIDLSKLRRGKMASPITKGSGKDMFAQACELARSFTRPIILSLCHKNGKCFAGRRQNPRHVDKKVPFVLILSVLHRPTLGQPFFLPRSSPEHSEVMSGQKKRRGHMDIPLPIIGVLAPPNRAGYRGRGKLIPSETVHLQIVT